jgi:hypothetical protein
VIQIGAPQKDSGAQYRGPHAPRVGTGLVQNGSSQVLGIRAADPDGGPPWGLRVSRTTRGLGCLQAGRMAGGQFGVFGGAKAFHNDGRLHPRATNDVFPLGGCAPLDANGRLFLNLSINRAPASAKPGSCNDPRAIIKRGPPPSRDCRPEMLRTVFAGLLGPQAESVTYTQADGSSKTLQTVGPQGAYLIVTRPGPQLFIGTSGGELPANSPITELRFKNGSSCAITQAGTTAGAGCALPGRQNIPPPKISLAQLRAPIRARAIQVRNGHFNLNVSFRTPIAIPDARSHFQITLRRTGRISSTTGITDRNYLAGATVSQTFRYLKPGGSYTGTVDYVPSAFASGQSARTMRVGTFTAVTP